MRVDTPCHLRGVIPPGVWVCSCGLIFASESAWKEHAWIFGQPS